MLAVFDLDRLRVTQKVTTSQKSPPQFFVMAWLQGLLRSSSELGDMGSTIFAKSFQSGAADLAGTAIVVGMAKGSCLFSVVQNQLLPSTLNTILHSIGSLLSNVPAIIGAWAMYIFKAYLI